MLEKNILFFLTIKKTMLEKNTLLINGEESTVCRKSGLYSVIKTRIQVHKICFIYQTKEDQPKSTLSMVVL